MSSSLSLQVETIAMKAGREHHALLEAETALDTIQIKIQSREDAFAVRLLNLAQGLKQLMMEGITRELPILGRLQVRSGFESQARHNASLSSPTSPAPQMFSPKSQENWFRVSAAPQQATTLHTDGSMLIL